MSIFSSNKRTIELTKNMSIMTKDICALKVNLKGIIESIKDDLDVHLDTINQNTNELQANYEYIAELDSKINKLAEKIDEIQMQINPQINIYGNRDYLLSKKEAEFFLNLYTVEDRISLAELARNSGLTIDRCEAMLQALSSKQIPIIRQIVDGALFVSIEYTFKDLQARKNILGIDTAMISSTMQ